MFGWMRSLITLLTFCTCRTLMFCWNKSRLWEGWKACKK